MSSCDSSSSTDNIYYRELENRVPDILAVLKRDKALSNMMLDMINNFNFVKQA